MKVIKFVQKCTKLIINKQKKYRKISPHLAQPGRASGCSCRLRAEKQQSIRHTETGLSKAQILQWGPFFNVFYGLITALPMIFRFFRSSKA